MTCGIGKNTLFTISLVNVIIRNKSTCNLHIILKCPNSQYPKKKQKNILSIVAHLRVLKSKGVIFPDCNKLAVETGF